MSLEHPKHCKRTTVGSQGEKSHPHISLIHAVKVFMINLVKILCEILTSGDAAAPTNNF